MVHKNGTSRSLYSNNTNSYGPVLNMSGWDLPWSPEACGAGIGFYMGINKFHILSDGTGTKYAVRGRVNGPVEETIGPFDL